MLPRMEQTKDLADLQRKILDLEQDKRTLTNKYNYMKDSAEEGRKTNELALAELRKSRDESTQHKLRADTLQMQLGLLSSENDHLRSRLASLGHPEPMPAGYQQKPPKSLPPTPSEEQKAGGRLRVLQKRRAVLDEEIAECRKEMGAKTLEELFATKE